MSKVAKRTFSLPPDQASYIDTKVAEGAYASGSEVVRAGLRALRERDEAVERWLREDVAPAYDAMAQNPSRGMAADDAFNQVRARHQSRTKAKRRG